MKRRIFSGLAAVCLLLTGCASGNAVSKAEGLSEAESAAETAAESSGETGTESAPQAASADEGWRDAYAKVLRGTVAKRFSLIYIDDDDIPEMTLHFSEQGLAAHADHPRLYGYADGEAIDFGLISNGGMDVFSYLERKGIIFSSYLSTGMGYMDYLRYENAAYTQEHAVTIDATGYSGADVLYTIDGENADEAQYRELDAQYDLPERRMTEGEYPVNEENIRKYVTGEDAVVKSD